VTHNDSELLHSFVWGGDQTAFGLLVDRHLGLVHAAAVRRLNGNAELAKEVSLDVFTILARKAPTLEGREALEPWLYETTRLAALAAGRKVARRARVQQSLAEMNDLSPDERPVDWTVLRPVLDEAMDELREGDRELMLLRYFSGLSHGEIGARLGLAENTARMRGERALERLRAVLVRRGIPSTGAALSTLLANHAFAQAASSAPAGLGVLVTQAALAGAGSAAGGALVGAVTFMSTTKVIVIAGLVTTASIGGSIYSQVQASRTEQRLRESEQRCSLSETQCRTLIGQLKQLQEENRPGAEKPAALTASQSTSQGAPKDVRSMAGSAQAVTKSSFVSMLDLLAASPEYLQLSQRRFALDLPLEYGPLYRKLGLSSEKIARLEPLLVEAQQIMWDTMNAARSNGLSTGDSSLAKVKLPDVQEVYGRIYALLGENDFKTYETYTKSSTARQLASQLAGNLYYTEQPLTGAQADVLVSLIQANSSAGRVSGMVQEAALVDWEKVHAQASGILTSAQLRVLRIQQERSALDSQVSELQQRLAVQGAQATPGS